MTDAPPVAFKDLAHERPIDLEAVGGRGLRFGTALRRSFETGGMRARTCADYGADSSRSLGGRT